MIIFDVGANTGSNSAHFKNDKNNTVYAFEPTPFLIETYLNSLRDDNYIIVNKAVSDFDGDAEFNIAGQCDWGCSSINTFEDNLSSTWPGRVDFKITAIADNDHFSNECNVFFER